SYGLLNDAITTDNAVAADASPAANASQHWNTVVRVPTDCPVGDTCNLLVTAVAGPTTDAEGATDEVTESTLASSAQTVDSFTVTPTGTVNAHSGQTVTYTVTATSNGNPVPGVTVVASSNNPSTTTIKPPASNTPGDDGLAMTGVDGTATFKVTDTAAETSTLSFSTEFNETSVVAGTDFTVTRTLITKDFTAVLTTITLSKDPAQPSYASQDYNAGYPQVIACLKDQEGSPYTGSHDNVIVNVSRSLSNGTNSTPDGTLGNETEEGSGCYDVNANSYPGDTATGTDHYTVYVDKNGLPGFQQGEDIGDTTNVAFAPGVITFGGYKDCTNALCNSQAQVGTVDTVTVGEKIGTDPVQAGTVLHLSLGSGTANFPATQPNGATRVDNTHATCTVVADGTCQVNVTDGNAEDNIDLTATDGHNVVGDLYIDFRNHSVAFDSASRGGHWTLYPTGTGDTREEDYGAPGTVMIDHYQLRDSNGDPLSDVPVTLSVDHGFFTPYPSNDDDYNTATFDPAPANGAPAGSLKSLGDSISMRTSKYGWVIFATSIGRDAGFDDNGEVLTTLSLTSNGVTKSGGNLAGNTQIDQDFTWTTNTTDLVSSDTCNNVKGARPNAVTVGCSDDLGDVVRGGALNGASVKISPVPGYSLTGKHTNGFNNSHNATRFYVQAKDQFGNLVGSPTSVSGTGAGNGTTCNGVFSAYNGEVTDGSEDTCAVNSTGSSPTTASPFTVTDTWFTQSTTFVSNSDNSPSAPAFVAKKTATVNAPTQTDSFTIELYSVDINNLHYDYEVLPAKIVKTGTTVHDEVTVTDQYAAPVEGLFVTDQRSGPGNVDDVDHSVTNAAGTSSYNFSSAEQGDATVTIDVYDCDINDDNSNCSGIPLSESVNTISFDGVPVLAVSPSHMTGPGDVTVAGFTRGGASVVLFEKTGSGNFTQVGTAQTADNDGSFGFTVPVTQTSSFKVVVDEIQTSATRTVTVSAGKIVEKPTLKLKSKHPGELTAKAKTHPKLVGETVRFYKVKANGHRKKLGQDTTNAKGKAKQTFSLKKGKTYTLVCKVVHLGKGYKSKFSDPASKKVKG
ncbi:MAG: Ig-like domain-containing protein, partial [Frankiaceae bacterium]|nr:Ig-like domain-containing protein [Frankiaceae bacterium]